jgi:hypothetical protein
MAVLVPGMGGLSDEQQRLFLLSLTLLHQFQGQDLDAARDIDVAEAAESLASTYETESKGVIYEHKAGSLPARRMAAEFRTVFDQLGRERPSAFVRDAATVLRRLEQLARSAEKFAAGNPRFFLDLVGRVSERIASTEGRPGPSALSDEDDPGAAGPSIIIP